MTAEQTEQVDLAGYAHVGWYCEHSELTRLPDVAPSSRIVNTKCGCIMAPVYAKAGTMMHHVLTQEQ